MLLSSFSNQTDRPQFDQKYSKLMTNRRKLDPGFGGDEKNQMTSEQNFSTNISLRNFLRKNYIFLAKIPVDLFKSYHCLNIHVAYFAWKFNNSLTV